MPNTSGIFVKEQSFLTTLISTENWLPTSNNLFTCFRTSSYGLGGTRRIVEAKIVMKMKKQGVAAVEAAVCLPVLALIVFGALEVTGGIFQEYNLQASAFELAKVALRRNATCEDIQDQAAAILPSQDFPTYSINLDIEPRTVNADSVEPPTGPTSFAIPSSGSAPLGLETIPRGTLMRITVTADRPRIPGRGLFYSFLNPQATADAVFVKEF